MTEVERPNIVAIFEHYDLRILGRDVGGWRKCQCPKPDHEDANPSASLNEDEGKWWCHGCSQGGDGFDIIMEREGIVGFADARRFAAGVLGESDDGVPEERGGSSLLPGGPRNRQSRSSYRAPWLGL